MERPAMSPQGEERKRIGSVHPVTATEHSFRANHLGRSPITETVIRPPGAFARLSPLECYRHRVALWGMIVRQVKSEYQNMYLGFLWAAMRPLLVLLVFTTMKRWSGARTGVDIPYSLYLYSGLVLWFYFVESLMDVTTSVKRDSGLIQKVYFPRIFSPLASTIASLTSLGLAVVPLAGLMAYHEIYPCWRIIVLPLVLAQLIALILGVGLIFAALSVENNDWQRLLAFATYLGMFLSPVIYSPDMIPERLQGMYLANPMAGTLLSFRSALCADFPFPGGQWAYSVASSLVLLGAGMLAFQKAERTLAERL